MSIVKDPTGIPLNYFAPADATALASEIKSGQTAYIGGGKVTGTAYTPAMMQFDGSTGYYSKSHTAAAVNQITAIGRFKAASFTGGGIRDLININGSTGSVVIVRAISSDYPTADFRSKLVVQTQDSSLTNLCRVISTDTVIDGAVHCFGYSYNAATGAVSFYIDGADADDTGNAQRILTTGTITSGANTSYVGAADGVSNFFNGQISYIGIRQAYLTNWSDFMDTNGNPKSLDESGWTEWGAQPLFWNPHGYMQSNRGSAGNMTANGGIIIGDGGST